MLYDSVADKVGAIDDSVWSDALANGRWVLDLVDDYEAVVGGSSDMSVRFEELRRLSAELDRRLAEEDASVRAAALCLALSGEDPGIEWVQRFTRLRLSWTPDQLDALWRFLETHDGVSWARWVQVALNGLPTTDIGRPAPSLRAVDTRLSQRSISRWDGTAALIRELRSHLKSVDGPATTLPISVLPPRDRWAIELRDWFEENPAPEAIELAVHLATIGKNRPTRAWQRMCVDLGTAEEAREFLRTALRILLTCEPTRMRRHGMQQEVLLDHVRNVEVARGVVWATALLEGKAAVPALEAVYLHTAFGLAHHPEAPVATAVVHALGIIDDPSAEAALERLRSRAFDHVARKQIDTALRADAKRATRVRQSLDTW
ncbi:hypothetical protein GCM10010191_70340 [Actinomadura vinacea]|uniref:HEAT repeat domain-containing protein n=1 Tax=Actinomadura vinacea TaxID=115336 RepID=A0ABN3K1N5_9ACTN